LSLPALTPAAELATLRTKYPDGLWCTSPEPCEHRLIASTAAGWSKSWAGLPEPERQARRDAYVCSECRQAGAEREQLAQVRRESAAAARAVAAQKRRDAADVRLQPAGSETAHRTGINSGDSDRVNVTARPAGPRRGGRPRKHAADALAQRRAAADRAAAYRKNKKAEQARRNDALLNGGATGGGEAAA